MGRGVQGKSRIEGDGERVEGRGVGGGEATRKSRRVGERGTGEE